MGKWDDGEFSRVSAAKMKRLYYAMANKASVEFDKKVERDFKLFIQVLDVDDKKVQARFTSLVKTQCIQVETEYNSRGGATRYGGYPSHIPRAHRHYEISTSRSGLRRQERARTGAVQSSESQLQHRSSPIASSDADPVLNARSSVHVLSRPSVANRAAEHVYHPYNDLMREYWRSDWRSTGQEVNYADIAGYDRESDVDESLTGEQRGDSPIDQNPMLHPHSELDDPVVANNSIDRPRSNALPDDWPALPVFPVPPPASLPSIVHGRSFGPLGPYGRSPFRPTSAVATNSSRMMYDTQGMSERTQRTSEHNDVPPPISPADIDELLAGITTGVENTERPHAVPGPPTDLNDRRSGLERDFSNDTGFTQVPRPADAGPNHPSLDNTAVAFFSRNGHLDYINERLEAGFTLTPTYDGYMISPPPRARSESNTLGDDIGEGNPSTTTLLFGASPDYWQQARQAIDEQRVTVELVSFSPNDGRPPSPVRRVTSRQSDMDRARLEAQPPIRRRQRSGAVDEGLVPRDGGIGLARHVRPRVGIDNVTPQFRDGGRRQRVRQSAPPQDIPPTIDIHTILQAQTAIQHNESEQVATDVQARGERLRASEPSPNFQWRDYDWETRILGLDPFRL